MEKVATKNTKSTKKTWPMVRLGDVCEFVRRGKSPIYCETSPYPMFAQKCNQPNGIFLDKCKFCEPAKYLKFDKEYRLQDKDILINSTGTGTLGRVGFFREEYLQAFNYESIVADSHVTIVRMNNQVLQEYLYLFMRQDFVYKWLNDIANGSTNQKELYPQHLVRLEFPLPPLSVQREIVARLEKELGDADALAAKFKEIAENADAEFKAELDETFKNVEGEKVRLGDVCENLDSKRIPITKSSREPGPYPYYGASGIVDYVKDYIFDGRYLLVSEDGANLVARATPIAFSVEGKIWVNNHAHILAFQSEELQNLVEYYFAAISVADIVTGAAQPKLTQKALNDIELPLPILPVQRTIVTKLDSAKDKCEKLKAAAERGLRASEDLRKAILAEAFD